MFQSSLPIAGERVSARPETISHMQKFQSSLPIAGERVVKSIALLLVNIGFNPRSPSLGSASDHSRCGCRLRAVSILAPHRWGARQPLAGRAWCAKVVSILAPHRWGARRP